MNEDATRRMLQQMAADVPPPSADPGAVAARARRRVARSALTGVLAFALIAAGGIAVSRSIGGGDQMPDVVSQQPGIKEASAVTKDGTLQCRAQLPVPLHPGRPARMGIELVNMTDRPVEYTTSFAWVQIVGEESPADLVHSRPMPMPQTLAPRATLSIPVGNPIIRRSGRLQIVGRCDVNGERLTTDPITADVLVPGATPTRADAVRRALAARPGLLERCMPGEQGDVVTGELVPPDPALPPLTARCGADVAFENGFVVVDVQITAPADAPVVAFPEDLNQIAYPGGGLPGSGPIALMRWRIVVTADEVIDEEMCCEAAERTLPAAEHRLAPFLTWREGRWRAEGASACGGMSNSFTWISVCSVNVTSSSIQKPG